MGLTGSILFASMAGFPSGLASDTEGLHYRANERTEQALARIGRSVAGRWTLTKLLGVGGMAAVYEAKHRNGRRAAVKVLHPDVLSHPTARRRFLSEGYAANKVEHPGVVLILDDGEDGDLVFLVMELLCGRSLADRLAQEGPLPIASVVKVASGLLDALAAAHDQGVVHRDIKPSNVFELENGEIKVLDFGVARVRDPDAATVTESGVTLGTPAFMAPEQALGQLDEVDAVTDVWAVGATMFQLLTGRLVHEAATPNALIVAAATKPARLVTSLRADVPDDLARTVERALAFRREDRWPNARAMRRALLGGPAAENMPAVANAATVPEVRPARPASREKRAIWAAPVLGLTVALGGVWSWLGPKTNVEPASAASPPPSLASPVPAAASATENPAMAVERVVPSTPPVSSATLGASATVASKASSAAPTLARPTKRANRSPQSGDKYLINTRQ
jgi:eukaryotic-like serine/threonine-protein kinase